MRKVGKTLSICYYIKDSLLKGDICFIACKEFPDRIKNILNSWGLNCEFTPQYNTSLSRGHISIYKGVDKKFSGYKITLNG